MTAQLKFGISMLAVALMSTSAPIDMAEAQDRPSTARERITNVQSRDLQISRVRPANQAVATLVQPAPARPNRPPAR